MEEFRVYLDANMSDRMILSRYMDLPKFADLLKTSKLYLASAVDFEDNLEGTLPELFRNDIVNSDVLAETSSQETIEEIEFKNKIRTNLGCWTIGARDNMALWKMYGGDQHSVRITTTLKRLLYSSAKWRGFQRITFKKVRYIDLGGKVPDGVYALDENIFGLKHTAYKFENEVRIVVTRKPLNRPSDIRLPVDLNQLLTRVTVAPNAGEWFFELINDLLEKYKISTRIEKSGLSALIRRAKTTEQ